MKNLFKVFGIIALVAVIGFSFTACGGDSGGGGGGDPDLSGTITISPTTGVTTGTKLTATYSGSETVSYQWKNGSANVGTNSKEFTPTEVGSYTVTVSATGYKSKTSAAVTVTVPTGPQWTEVADSTFGSNQINAIAYGNDKFVAVGENGKVATSTDGKTWTAVNVNSIFYTITINAITYGNDKFVAGGKNGLMATSTDGVTWTVVGNPVGNVSAIAYGNGKFVAVGFLYDGSIGQYIGEMATSTDGVTWTAIMNSISKTNTITIGPTIWAIAYGNDKFVANGNGDMTWSTDGVTWTPVTSTLGMVKAIAYGNGKFVALNGVVSNTSSDGINWTKVSGSTYYVIDAIAYGNGKFVAGGIYDDDLKDDLFGKTVTSTDGVTWTAMTNSTFDTIITIGPTIRAIAYGNGKFVAVGGLGKMAYLSDN